MHARTRRTCLLAAVALGLVVAVAGTSLAQSSGPTNIGVWKLNLAKSTYSPGTAPKSATITIAAAGAAIKTTVDSVAADGTASHWETIGNYDGQDIPVVGNNASADTVARTRVDANTTKSTFKKAGKVTSTLTSVVSGDGKTLTITSVATNAQGQTVNTVTVYDKQ